MLLRSLILGPALRATTQPPLAVVYADGDTVSLRHAGTRRDRIADPAQVCSGYGARTGSQGTTAAGDVITLHVTCDRPIR